MATAVAADSTASKVESSSISSLLNILRKFIHVPDLAQISFSLPSQYMEPIPNLEYWTYLDRPDTFASMGDSNDSLSRMLAVIRFWFAKDLKFVKAPPCKPYNSILGEFFRCNWIVNDSLSNLKTCSSPSAPASSSASSTASKNNENGKSDSIQPLKISFLTEQTSHRPPVSAYVIDCPQKQISARGFDQISAKFTGTAVRVSPGDHNLGIFINLQKWNEEYQLTHPTAYVKGILHSSLYVTVSDSCYITCPVTKTKVIIEYLENRWIGSTPKNSIEGVIFTYDPDNDEYQKLKHVPAQNVLARIGGTWTGELYYTLGGDEITKQSEKHHLIDLKSLTIASKVIPPIKAQLANESRRCWEDVTTAIRIKDYSKGTRAKTAIEGRQRERAAEREKKGVKWQPRFFTAAVTPEGRPELTEEGKRAIEKMHSDDWILDESAESGA